MALLEDLKWRYATKKMNGQAVPEEKLNYILEAARLAPSTSGLQPYKILVVTDKQKLEDIKKIANNQSQVVDGSHLLIWVAWDHFDEAKAEEILLRTGKERGMPAENSIAYKNMLVSKYGPQGKQWQADRMAKQAYISFGLALAAAAEQKVDATPMEGFDNEALDKYLGLNGWKSVVMMPIGYRDEEGDWLVKHKKFRLPMDEFVEVIK
ncbi:nitroreductase [Leadbetterella byssophila DSM 17132]|uniref:Nitroreductase n=1 Tax=Leadbetterella byssophila (strain DSM 17132 / JCM 16389 / KACC 11308 / NBRC 106382 / 4M15) TaxID=649349 RepID=E4RUE9_LEAB4|nr:nitroreductase family protein [Leadbetterella byssophila]ADQ17840.1 nitroreductase [Leadbetterella byssophila DSM 17132]